MTTPFRNYQETDGIYFKVCNSNSVNMIDDEDRFPPRALRFSVEE